jgi:DNA-binding NtrC family response regulator
MKDTYIICIDDEADVLDVVIRDLSCFEDTFPVESAENTQNARTLIEGILKKGHHIGVILCDHVMPGENGVDLLVELEKREELKHTRKILLTGQAGLDATIIAVNQARLAQFISKPWQEESLVNIVRKQMTQYIIDSGLDPKPYLTQMDPELLSEAVRLGFVGDR